MSNLQIIEELCRICEAQSFIIKAQAEALEQVGAVVMEKERADVGRALTAMIGHDEAMDEAEVLALPAAAKPKPEQRDSFYCGRRSRLHQKQEVNGCGSDNQC